MSVYLSVCLSVYLSVCLSVRLSLCLVWSLGSIWGLGLSVSRGPQLECAAFNGPRRFPPRCRTAFVLPPRESPAERCTKNMENARRETQRLSLFVLPYPVCDSRPEYFLVVFGGGLWLDVF
ncbi:hypothetical protein F5X98DRAFT_37771 [Xylaria grammica]|nr:hypothetical protein F5X98DRAFT_37771 [Xylaria grammica]